MPLLLVYRLEGGKIVEHWLQADQMGLMRQLATEPALASA